MTTTTPLLQPDYLEVPLTIRFSASIPDILIDVPSPATTTAAGLKQLIRTRLPRDLAAHRLRLIYSGRALEDAVPLATSLRLPSQYHQHSRGPSPIVWGEEDEEEKFDDENGNGRGKGKMPVRDPPMRRLYIHCSVGDIVLSKVELDKEAKLASTISQRQAQQQQQQGRDGSEWNDIPLSTAQEKEEEQQQQQQRDEEATTTPAPRGFDRLLSAGFTPAEVSALRSQFLALQSVSHTPDTMPSGSELRELEDRWMDEGTGAVPAGGIGGGGGGGAFGDDDGGFGTGSRGALDDMLWGAVMGFFWPVGCAMWLRREEGVWSWRKGLAVFVGVVINGAFGAMMIMN
ncbi:hypothetical protein DTO282E5_696 [Paecilomyces variotii]|nr:hypothetical protein DTO282E5_696 [Paecilomyces variotii]